MLMSSQPETRHSLLLRLRNREDQQAWHEFFEIYQPLIYRLARARGAQDAEAQDITQDVLMSVSRAMESYQLQQHAGAFRGWLATITRNTTLNRLRSLQSRQQAEVEQVSLDGVSGDAGFDATAEREFQYEHRRQVFLWAAGQLRDRFSQHNWDAFWLTCVEGQSIESAADRLQMSQGAVYVARCRVIARLREIVELRTGE